MKFKSGMIVIALAVCMIGCWPQSLWFGTRGEWDHRISGWRVEMRVAKVVDNSNADTLSGYFLYLNAMSRKQTGAGVLIIDSLSIFGNDLRRITPMTRPGYGFGTVGKPGKSTTVYADIDLGNTRPDTLVIQVYYTLIGESSESAEKFSFDYRLPFSRTKTWYGGR